MNEVIVAGNVGIDTNVYLSPDFDPADLTRREATFSTNVDGVGQAGGYSSIGYARLGRRVGFVGYVGDDPLGRWIEAELREVGVHPLLFVDPAGTSRSINLMRPDGTRNNFYDGKSHMTLHPDGDACKAFLQGARLLHLHIANWGRELLPMARARGAVIACDLQDVRDVDDPYRDDFIRGADVLFCSAVEADDPEVLARALARKNPSATVVLGCGAEGAGLWCPNQGFSRFPPVDAPEPVVDTNGAGDSLAVGCLAARILEGRPWDEAIHWGQVAARFACTLRGQESKRLITRAELDARRGG